MPAPIHPPAVSVLGAFKALQAPAAHRPAIVPQLGGVGPISVSGFVMQTQACDQWCWAAVAVSVAHKYDPASTWDQCSLASALYAAHGQALDCCGTDCDTCNQPQGLSDVFGVTHNLRGAALSNSITVTALRAEIAADRPVALRIGWPPDESQGHFIVVTGIHTGPDGVTYVDVGDPSSGDDVDDNVKHMSLDELTANYGLIGGQWDWTYRTTA